ncbi:DNA circulation family protein [Burkholderia multivorans]|uniref:DNA circularization protein n=1 Tax=Burkholderia multivorans TaxID=87883 RepID=UPI000CFF292C|nr:DNA circularization N-terminal domain-containing protein [Burkholderia multivorans]MBR8021252.1 DNA circularization N-terminal domain-containing protein [Burkholderia multivorans]PRE60602.1 DNA circulation family protein [Burkholderia multivorans]PRF16501.1 DNA circulation family protein [Burkholderia multivorans]HEF4732746.1 DNA circularization N-terminal domain-containing protein [Burkholderia multivorans]
MSLSNLVSLAGSIGGVARAASDLASILTGPLAGSWWGALRQASYGGVPFAVVATNTRFGTRNVVHEYPFRDDAWVEEIGKLPRRFEIIGFLVEDSHVYGGGPVIMQRDRLVEACENGAQTLVHPTFGRIDNVACLGSEISESVEHGRVIMVRFVFQIQGARIYPNTLTDTTSLLDSVADSLGVESILDFAKDVATAVKTGAAAVQATVNTVVGWYQIAQNDINDVRRFFNSVSTLAGNFGRFFGGGNSGFTATNRSAPIGTTAVQLLQSDANARQAVQAAASALSAAAAHPSDSTSFGAAAQAYVTALRATAADPADGIRMLMNLASYMPSPVFGTSTISQAMQTMQSSTAALLRRSAQAGLARAVASWQPTSFDDAQTMMKTVTQQFDAEIEIAADAGDDSSYAALRQVRNAIVEDLQARGGGLATLSTFEFNGNLPALVIAHRIYGDASRADQLVQQVQPVNPLFMPASFDALSS